MKVAHLIGTLGSGGAEILVLNILKNAVISNIDCICIFRKEGNLSKEFANTQKQIINLSPQNKFDIYYLLRLRNCIKTNNIDIIHTHQIIDTLFAKIATMFTKTKIIQTYHGHGFFYKLKSKFIRRLVANRTNLNLFVSKTQLNYYKQNYSYFDFSKCKVLHNGISFSQLLQATDKNPLSEFSIDNRILILGTVGNFSNGRDQMTICRFLALLNKQSINFKFFFVGAQNKSEPELYDNCIKFCEHNNLLQCVHFVGRKNNIPQILKQLDVFVYSTAHDTFGIAVVEAMNARIPVFINDWKVFKEITENGKYATLYKTKDEHDLLNKFNEYLKNPQPYFDKAIKASEYVRSKFDIKTHISNLEKIYAKLIQEK